MTIPVPARLDVVPYPAASDIPGGFLSFETGAQFHFHERFAFESGALASYLTEAGIQVSEGGVPIRGIHAVVDSDGLGNEGYALEIGEEEVTLTAASAAGMFYGVQTLRQMLIASQSRSNGLPFCRIVDRPKFAWRGFLFDVSRHFYTVDEVKRLIDILALHKMNVLHWHLVDDGGWRIEIEKYPMLTKRGAWRLKKDFVWDYLDIDFPEPGATEEVYGGFYTHDDIREVVAYAEARHITVMPEIEMPGHSLAALWSYPELGCTPAAVEVFRTEVGMREPNVFCAGKERSFEFLSDVLEEVISLFPSKYIHVGGDEVFKVLFENCADCRQRMIDEGLQTVDELQSYFIRRMEKFVNSKGRILVGWDEILQGGLAPNAVVMSWRGVQGGLDAARAGHDVIMTPYSHCYFDFGYDQSPTKHVAEFDPVSDGMSPAEAAHVLGGQANLWTEYVPDFSAVQRMMLPRLAAMAEVLWTGMPDPLEFESRLEPYKQMLDSLGFEWMADETMTVPEHHTSD